MPSSFANLCMFQPSPKWVWNINFVFTPGFSSLNDYLVDATTPEGTAQEISSGFGEAVGQVVVPGAMISKGLKA